MSDAKEMAMPQTQVESAKPDPAETWREHRQTAVKAFLKNAVLIDNEPTGFNKRSSSTTPDAAIAAVEDDGMTIHQGETRPQEITTGTIQNEKEIPTKSHELDVRATSDAFSEAGIACAFVLPDDDDKDEDKICNRILNAAAIADIVIIDWFLREQNSNLTRKTLTRIAEEDTAENGRMRLICIYTGQAADDSILDDAVEALATGGIKLEKQAGSPMRATGPHCLLLVLSKNEISPERLPATLLDAFAELANGLLPAFALAAVAAVRNNVHHMVTCFSADLDAAYVANRLITDPPGDVAELIRELFISECDNALGLDGVADEFLETPQIQKWLDATNQPKSTPEYENKGNGKKEQVKLDRQFLECLLQHGVSDKDMILDSKGTTRQFPEYRRYLVSHALNENADVSVRTEQEFARFVALKREAFGNTKLNSNNSHWRPSLTIGTLLKKNGAPLMGSEYFMCLTPPCDTLRLKGKERRFVFLGNTVENDKCSLVVVDETKNLQHLYFDSQQPNIFTFYFTGDSQTGRVQATARDEKDNNTQPVFEFATSNHGEHQFIWLGEVRYNRATGDMADVMRNWMRIGINDSEFLRLAAKGSAKFK